jgi:hypothetical protein
MDPKKENILPILLEIADIVPNREALEAIRDMAMEIHCPEDDCGLGDVKLVAYVFEPGQLNLSEIKKKREAISFDLETEIYKMLIQIAPLSHLANFDYLKLAIKYYYERTKKEYVSSFIKTVYVDVANHINSQLKNEEEKTNPMRVEGKIRTFISNHIVKELNKPEKEKISAALSIPTPVLNLTPKEFIGFAVEYLRRRENELNDNITGNSLGNGRGAYEKKVEPTLGEILGIVEE